ncbi:hypothetical protein EYF80_023537 [Liparis tanakae]|uniref:Uncharacterized protein n=1 Tax=Liparis tanakae TaxID=230148 RepID=A0A4Z2HK50_9TELE|nr:hypothetical protein EYF80_023537 [Liparis tanakae]
MAIIRAGIPIRFSTSLSRVWGQQLLPKCIRAKACQPALPAHSKGQSVSGGAPVGGCKVRLVGGWPGWSFLTREPASQQDQTGCRVNHYPSHYLTGTLLAHAWPVGILSIRLADGRLHGQLRKPIHGDGASAVNKAVSVVLQAVLGPVFNVYFSVVNFWLSSHIWQFRLVSSQLIEARCRQPPLRSAAVSLVQPRPVFSTAACHSVCTRRVAEQIKSHL